MITASFRVATLATIAALPAGTLAQSFLNQQELPRQLTLRASGALPTSMQKLLAELGATRPVNVPAGKDPNEVIRAFCGGSVTNDYLDEFDSRYPTQRSKQFAVDRQFELQACVRSTSAMQRQVISVPEGDAAKGLAWQAFGVAPDTVVSLCDGKPQATFSSCTLPAIEALRQYNGNKSDWLAQLKPGQRVGVPRITAFTTILLKEGVTTNQAVQQVQEAAAKVKEETGVQVLAGVQGSGQFRTLALLKQNDPLVKGTPCEAQADDPLPDWPYPASQMLRMLELSRQEATRRGVKIQPAVVRIADTGAVGLKTYFPLSAISANLSIPEEVGKNGQGRFGIDAEYKGDVSAFPEDPNGLHGTYVADLALGGHGFRSKYSSVVYEMVQVTFFKIFMRASGGNFAVEDGTLLRSMAPINGYAPAAVVNFSVGGPDELHTSEFPKQVLQASYALQPLVVVAAGNTRDDLTFTPTFPAAYGGNSEAGNWMIVVGASAPGLAPAMYSNYSSDVVDILAPGCRLPNTAPGGGGGALNGTSVAAPQVSFVAALLRSLGLGQMSDAKIRIIAASDFRPELKGRSRYSSVLNAPRAVAIYHDVVRIKGESQDRTGHWEFDAVNPICEDVNIPATQILSITPYSKGEQLTLRVLYTTATNKLGNPVDCKPADFKLNFVEDNGKPLEPPPAWQQISVLVPAQKRLALPQ